MGRKVVDVPMLLARLAIPARLRGDEWWAACPLPDHPDSKPSWSIADAPADSARHGKSRCFGCGRGFGPLGLVMRVLDVDADEARRVVRDLERDGDVLPPVIEVAARIPPRGVRWPVDGALRCWDDWPEQAKRYWTRRRGLPAACAAEYGVVATAQSVDAPLSIVFPVVSFGAMRTWVARSYVPTERGHRSASRADGAQPDLALWGEPDLFPQLGPALVCEGIFDALSLRAMGLANAVAVLGASNLMPAKVAAIARCGAAVVCTDDDRAGDEAADALVQMLGRHVPVARARPPAGHDFGSAPVRAAVESVERAVAQLRRAS